MFKNAAALAALLAVLPLSGCFDSSKNDKEKPAPSQDSGASVRMKPADEQKNSSQ